MHGYHVADWPRALHAAVLAVGCVGVSAGDIDFEEFKQLVYDGILLEGAIQEYEDAFNAVDNSGNGSIGAYDCCDAANN